MNRHANAGRFRLGWILIVIAALNGAFWTVFRWHYENTLTGAQITVDYDDTRTMADAYQIRHAKFLALLKERGVSSIGLYSLSLNGFRDNGRIAITPREEAERLYPKLAWNGSSDAKAIPAAYRYLVTATRENQDLLLNQLLPRLRSQGQSVVPPQVVELDEGSAGVLLPRSAQLFGDAMMGFDPAQLKAAKSAGLVVTARVSNSLNLNLQRVRQLLDDAENTGARVVIFSEDEVVGYDSLVKQVAAEMQDRKLLFGNIEFTKQRGWQDFAKLTAGNLVRVHSVGGDEAAKARVELLVDRYARAIKERDIRVAYIRLVRQFKGKAADENNQAKSALQQNLDFVQAVSDELVAPIPSLPFLRPAMETRGAQAFGDYPLNILQDQFGNRGAKIVRYLSAFLSGLGAVGATLLLLNLFFDLSRRAQKTLLFSGVLLAAVLSVSAGMGAKLLALQIGITFSAIGVLWGGLPQLWDASRKRGETGRPADETSPLRAFAKGTAILVKTSLLTFIGPLLIIALLNNWKFFSGTDKYLLPKATQLFPLLLVGLAFAGEVFPHRVAQEGAEAARKRARDRFLSVLNRPFTVRIALTLVALFFAGTIWIARTGNDSGMEISAFELKFRAGLEQFFITRPRTKEIFAGMPAMIFAVYFATRRKWLLALGAAVVATIGQADLLNTFCHIHTPFFYSLLRSIHGVWLGALIGGVALAIYVFLERRIAGRFQPQTLPPMESTPEIGRTFEEENSDENGHVDSEIGTVFVPQSGESLRR